MNKVGLEDYYIGLDIGTDSIGWAVTDEAYRLLKAKGKEMWGIRLFDGADTAEQRRVNRGTRRRVERRRNRIKLLQELFAQEMMKVDEAFFQRLKDSKLFIEDKVIHQPFALFNDKDYTDREYYKDYPTIYHLRKALIEGEDKCDLRLLYIAIHHLLKNRGHFIFEGNVEAATSFEGVYGQFVEMMKEELHIEIEVIDPKDIAGILKNKQLKLIEKKSKLAKGLNISTKDKQLMAILSVVAGGKAKLGDILKGVELEALRDKSIGFSEGSYEESYQELEAMAPDSCYVLDVLKALYDWALLAEILKDDTAPGGTAKYLSFAKVNQYNKHQKDLQMLKQLMRYSGNKVYKEMFASSQVKDNYCAYIGSTKVNGKKHTVKRCTQEAFYGYVKKALGNIEIEQIEIKEMKEYVLKEIEKQTLLPLQVAKSNGVIPQQVHYIELDEILKKAEKQHEFLNQKDEQGISIADKIRQIFLFRIPYYVGPLNDFHKEKGGQAWLVRRTLEQIRPWNIEKVVDIDASGENFIRRMTNKCTYLTGEDVLPKNSLIYQEYTVLNELNNIRVKGEPLTIQIKEVILQKLFKKEGSVTKNKLYKCLKSEGYVLNIEDITGIEEKFLSSLKSYQDFLRKVFGEKIEQYKYKQMAEEIICYNTIYGEDKKMLKRVLKNKLGTSLTDEEIKAIMRLRYTGWGNLSHKLLTGIEGVCYETGESTTILRALHDTSHNLMQLLSSQYSYGEVIEKENCDLEGKITEISYDALIKDLRLAPAVKRVVWQTVEILQEIQKILGKKPKKIFVEMARGGQEKARTTSRKDQLIKLYEACKEESREWKEELENTPESDFRSIKLYLYYTQKGKCMYTGESIRLDEIANVNIYDRDHIYARSKTKDDSLDNLVLVKKVENAKKDNGVVSPEIQVKMGAYWKSLLKGRFISQEKYNRLMRKTPLTPEELAGFINRQLVEARQSSKAVATLLKQLNPTSDIVYVKAKLVAEFRQKELQLIKSRSMNDLHHAKDAYLNIVVGNVYHSKFTNNPLRWLKDNVTPEYSLNQMYNNDFHKKEQCIWKRGEHGTKATVRHYMAKNNILYTRYATCNKGQLFDEQIKSPKENPTIPIKKGMDIQKYGGYKSINPAYFALLESKDSKGKILRTIESIPIYLEKEFAKEPLKMIRYCEQYHGLKDVKIIIPCIKKNALFKIDGFIMNLRGSTGQQLIFQGAVQLCLGSDEEVIIKKVEKYLERNAIRIDKKQNLKITSHDKIKPEENLMLYDVFIKKHENTIYQYKPANQVKNLKENREKFNTLSLEQQCIVLGEILHLFQCKPLTADLSLLGEGKPLGKTLGKIQIGKKLTSGKKVILIHQSITGLYEQKIDLLKL